jgi:hypothetical protein
MFIPNHERRLSAAALSKIIAIYNSIVRNGKSTAGHGFRPPDSIDKALEKG